MALSEEKESLAKNLCDKCPTLGLCCCHAILIVKGKEKTKVYLPNIPCKFLDTKTKLCTVYKDRFEKNPYCNSMTHLAKDDGCPPECLYKDHLNFHVKKTRVAEPLEEKEILVKLVNGWVKKGKIPFTISDPIRERVEKIIAQKKRSRK